MPICGVGAHEVVDEGERRGLVVGGPVVVDGARPVEHEHDAEEVRALQVRERRVQPAVGEPVGHLLLLTPLLALPSTNERVAIEVGAPVGRGITVAVGRVRQRGVVDDERAGSPRGEGVEGGIRDGGLLDPVAAGREVREHALPGRRASGTGHAAGDERVTRGARLELPVAVVPPEAHGGAVQWLVGAIGCAISPLSRRDRAQGGPADRRAGSG